MPVLTNQRTAQPARRNAVGPLHVLVEAPQPGRLIDGCGRQIDHLRLSVTGSCNLRCTYCRPADSPPARSRPGNLSDRQRLELVTFLHRRFGLEQVRLTGGEPLLHSTLVNFIAEVRSHLPDIRLAMTTNGSLLARMAGDLRRAGLDRLNVSVDSIDLATYHALTGGLLEQVLAGLDAAEAAGFEPPRINTVVLRGINDTQIVDLAEWAMRRGSEIRFLEAMPIGPAATWNRERFVPAVEILRRLGELLELYPLPRGKGETAVRYRASCGTLTGVVGMIAPLSESFCGQCRRVRVTAEGRLYPCLLDDRSVDLRDAWVAGCFDPDRAERLVSEAVEGKKAVGPMRQHTGMVALGG